MKLCLIFTVVFGLHTGAFSQDIQITEGFLSEINQQGVNLIAQGLGESSLADISDLPLPDVDDRSDGVDIEVRGLKAWIDFGDLKMKLARDGIQTSIDINRVRIYAKTIRLYKSVLGGEISTTCKKTNVYLGEDGRLPLTTNVVPSVKNRKVSVKASGTSFKIDEDNYRVRGPDQCSGALGIGSLIKSIVRSTIIKSRAKMVEAVKKEVAKLAPELAKTFNRSLNQKFPISIPRNDFLPEADAQLSTWPSAMSVNQQRIQLVLGVESEKLKTLAKTRPPLPKDSKAVRGLAGLKPQVLNELLSALYPNGTGYRLLDEESIPHIQEVLGTSTMSTIWPDLAERELTKDFLRVAVMLKQTPRFSAVRGAKIQVSIPQIHFLFYANIDHQWQEYFTMDIDLTTDIEIASSQGQLSLVMLDDAQLVIDGYWADDIDPGIDAFEVDSAEFVLHSLLEYMTASGPLFKDPYPNFPGEIVPFWLQALGLNGAIWQSVWSIEAQE